MRAASASVASSACRVAASSATCRAWAWSEAAASADPLASACWVAAASACARASVASRVCSRYSARAASSCAGQLDDPLLRGTPAPVCFCRRGRVLSGQLLGLGACGLGLLGGLQLGAGQLLGRGSSVGRFECRLRVVAGRFLRSLPGAGLRGGQLLGARPLAHRRRGGLRLRGGSPLGRLAFAGPLEGGLLRRTTCLDQLCGRLLGGTSCLVGLLRRRGVLGGELLGCFPRLGRALGRLLGRQPLGRLVGRRLLGGPPQLDRSLGRPGVLDQPRLHGLGVVRLARMAVAEWPTSSSRLSLVRVWYLGRFPENPS